MLKEPAEPYFKRLKALIAVSSSARQFISQYYKADYHIIPNGIDTKRFSPEVKPMEQYKNDKDFKILFLGRMDPRKGFKYLLRAFPLIYQKITNVKIIVVGGGIMKHWYKMALPSELSPRVDYHGFVPNDQVPRFYAACDLYCSPATRGESFGIVLLEAMASGKPVVASNIHGYNSIVKDGQTGFLVEKKNPLALAESIIKLAKNKEMRNNMEKFPRSFKV